MRQKVNCKYFLSDWSLFGNVYTCKVQCEVISSDADLVFVGRHWIGKDNYDVKGLSFIDCVITRIPKGLKRTFPSLQFLQVYNSKLKDVKRADLRDYSSLLALHLGNNLIEFVPGDLLVNFANLEALSLSNNRIQEIENGLLDGLRSLKFVSLRKNLCIDMAFDLIGNTGNASLYDIKEKIRGMNEARQPSSSLSEESVIETEVKPFSRNFVDAQRENEVLTYQNLELKVKCEALSDEKVKMSQEIEELRQRVTKLEEEKVTELKILRDGYETGLLGDIKQILSNDSFKNFTIFVEGEAFRVHRLLLAARSPVFAQMLCNQTDADTMQLVDISVDVFRIVLDFMYTDELPNDSGIDFARIFVTASQLKIEKLKSHAVEKLTDAVSSKNAFELLILANKYESEKLRLRSFEEIQKLFPNKSIDASLSTQTDKLRKLFEFKRKQDEMTKKLEDEFHSMLC